MTDDKPKRPAKPSPTGQGKVQIVQVQTRFGKMAGKPGRMTRNEAIGAADAYIEQIEPRYLIWAENDLKELIEITDQVFKESRLGEHFHGAYRKANHLRDLGDTFDYPVITRVADSMCELLMRLHDAGVYNREALETHMAALRLVCTARFKGVQPGSVKELLDSLHKLVNRYDNPDARMGIKE